MHPAVQALNFLLKAPETEDLGKGMKLWATYYHMPTVRPAKGAVAIVRPDRFVFALPVQGLATVPAAGTLLARDGDGEVRTPYDHCVLIMPTRRPKVGETAVRLGRHRT